MMKIKVLKASFYMIEQVVNDWISANPKLPVVDIDVKQNHYNEEYDVFIKYEEKPAKQFRIWECGDCGELYKIPINVDEVPAPCECGCGMFINLAEVY